MKIRLTNGSGLIREADWGFSWKTFFFGMFVPLVRGDVAWFFIGLCLVVFTAGIGLLIFPFVYNKIYVKKQLEKGFYPLDELSRMTLVNANLILDKGPLSQGTQQVPTSTPPAVQVSPKETPVVEVPRPVLPTSTPSPQAAEAPPPSPTGWACVSCRAENAPENRFCFACGREREKPKPVCPSCGERMDGKMKFCPSCGSALSGHGDNKGIDTRPTEVSPPVVQPYQATAPNPAPIPTVSQQTTSKPASFPAVAVAAIVLALGVLILVLSKGDVLFSFFKGSEKVTASQENPPAQVASQPVPAVQVVESSNFVQIPASGWISASNVNMRSGHSILSQRIATLPRGQDVKVLGSWVAESDQEAILKKELYVEVGGQTKTLGKGKAVSLVQHDLSQRTYLVSLQDRSGTISGWTSEENVKSLKGALWYKVSTPSGTTGWVLGEFVSTRR